MSYDFNQIDSDLQTVNGINQNVMDIVNSIIGNSTSALDNYMAQVKNCLLNDMRLSDDDVNRIVTQLPVYIYDLIPLVQQLEIGKANSSEDAKYTFNEQLLMSTGTVAEKSAKAENASADKRIINLAYKTATTLLQKKIDGALTIWSGVKRVQDSRMQDRKLTGMVGSSVAY